MLLFAIKNKTESNEKLILRYKKMFFQSRIANKLRKERYAVRGLSDRKVREKAITRELYRTMNKSGK